MLNKLFFIGTIGILISGCISGPKNPEQKFSEKLNGDSYESSNTVIGVPVLTRKPISKKISGRIYCGEGLSQRLANHVTVSLLDNDKIVSTASTDSNGIFSITANISLEKSYKLQAAAKCGTATKEISLKDDSNYDLILKN